ncbi:PEGA domain-containing protein [Sorangium sp. So ce542]|uniref:PEGA domain-containing protein n=1 Tax=Sorangium sp. So ce542 TaxID=3133316 RepID=UPI003F618475
MTMNFRSVALLISLATAIAVPDIAAAQPPAPQQAAGSADAAKRAEALVQKAGRLYSDGKYQEAEALLLPAWELNPTFDVAYNLGNTEYQLKKYREAAQYLSFALRHWPLLKGVAKLKPNAEKWLSESRAQVGAVGVTVSMAGAEVLVDGKVTGRAPLEGEVFVEPGEHRVEARLSGYETASQTVRVGKGGTVKVELAMTLAKSEANEATPVANVAEGASAPGAGAGGGPAAELAPGAPVEPASPPQPRSWVPVLALGAASAVGLGMTVASRNARSDADAQRAAILSRGPGCVNAPSDVASACDAFKDTAGSAEAFGTGALVAYVASGALAAGAVTYALWPRSATTGSSVGIRPIVSLATSETMVGVVGAW